MRAASSFVRMPPGPELGRRPARDACDVVRDGSTSEITGPSGAPSCSPSTSDSSIEHVGPDEVRDECGQQVVLAEPDLIGGHRVVLVHDRHGAERQQAPERVLRIDVLPAVQEVGSREQHLSAHTSPALRTRSRTRP